MDNIFRLIDDNYNEYKKLWIDICNIESKSSDKAGNNLVADYLERFSINKGYSVTRHSFGEAGDCLTITYNGEAKLPGIALLAHIDTVHEKGKFGDPPVTEKDGFLYGPGVIDCKGGIAIALDAMEALVKSNYNKRTIKLILTSDEEVSSFYSGEAGKKFIGKEVKGFAAALSCEIARDNEILVGRKGVARFEVQVTGIPAHSGISYSKGVSAIKEAAHKIISIERTSRAKGITYNCGTIEGGKAINIIPENCTFDIDVRYRTNEDYEKAKNHIERIVAKSYLKGTSSVVKAISKRPPMVETKENVKLFEHIKKCSEKYDLETLKPEYSGGGSDAAYTVEAGVPSIDAIGATGFGEHTPLEKGELESLSRRAKMIAASIIELPDEF